ncbi:MoaD/ThiS family protein [Halarsenatibacter silvermanii]|uniref:MoaD/ThiS family protein n=1 Tax=Halarsenatibacter silvermanii TaxID=321763 RepID=UPI0022855501|nr:MoaD/ThiS family protein [Halarsenatibacter silvermanii]
MSVNLYGGLEEYSPKGKRKNNKIDADKIDDVRDLVKQFEIPEEEIQVILIDGKHADLDSEVKKQSVVSIFPLIGGG